MFIPTQPNSAAEFHRPKNKEELFNLQHSSLQNAVECIFGIVKWCFKILKSAPEYDIQSQARLVAALAALHNFICIHDPDKMGDFSDDVQMHDSYGSEICVEASSSYQDCTRAEAKREEIAVAMWQGYIDETRHREMERS